VIIKCLGTRDRCDAGHPAHTQVCQGKCSYRARRYSITPPTCCKNAVVRRWYTFIQFIATSVPTSSTLDAHSALTRYKFVYNPAHRLVFKRSSIDHLSRRGLLWGAATVVNCGPISSPVHGIEDIPERLILRYAGKILCICGCEVR